MLARTYVDMTGKKVDINYPPKRIISLVPSLSELLYDLALDDEVVGITKFCVHPEEWFRTRKRVGGTKQVHIEIVKELEPDLIIANKEENTKEQIEALEALFPVWISDIRSISDAYRMIEDIGAIVDREYKASLLIFDIMDGIFHLPKIIEPKRVAYLIWRDPWMCAGGDTFISNMIDTMGWKNSFSDKARYPEISKDELALNNPDLVLLSSEPYPFKEKHIAEIKDVVPAADVLLVDGEMFSWYGSRMLLAIPYLSGFIETMR